jgi:hypothetical protein
MKKLNVLKKFLKDRLSFSEEVSISVVSNEVHITYNHDMVKMFPGCIVTIIANLCETLGATYYIDNELKFRCYYNERTN